MEKTYIARKVFNSAYKVYDTFLSLSTFGLINYLQNQLIKNTPLKENILDIGTGTGEILRKINKKYKNKLLIGVDISENMLKRAKEKIPDANFIKADAENLPFKEKSIDNIFYSLTFRHLDSEKQINQCKNILKTNGTVSILDLNRSKFLIFLFEKLFKPVGKIIFSEEEYNYFLESLKYAKKIEEIENIFKLEGFKTYFKSSYLFSTVIIIIFKKEC
jgi:demethylmenaquinone methyltransferase/2-methoxy-6-polyprenyl-1,4-benzoquinol methylase